MEKTKKLKAIAILTIAIMIVQVILPLSSALAVKIGDINGDGRISITDLSLLKQYLVSGRSDYTQAMDINSDNRITITDLSRLKLILVGELPEPGDTETGDIEITLDTTSWTNENVKATITYPNLGSGYKKQYSLDGSTWQEYTRTVEVEKNGVIYARLLNSSDQVVASTNVTISNIDKLAPQSFEAQIKQSVTNVIRVIGETEDEEARDGSGKSGVARYYFSKNSGTNWETNQDMSENQYIYKDLESSTEYGMMVRAIDGAGNTTETPIRRVKTYKNIIDILIDRGVITEDQVDRETGIITLEDGSQYKIEIKDDGGYEVVYVGPEALEDLTEDERKYQELQQAKLEEEIEKGLKEEIIDRLIEEGRIDESQVDRETLTIEDSGIIYEIEIKEDGTYEIVEVGRVEEAEPVVVYTVEPEGATKIATIKIVAKGKNITQAILPTGETKTYSNVEEIREEVQVSANGKYTVKVTGNGKETEKTIIVTNIIETPEIQIEVTTTEPTNLTEEMKVTIKYGRTILTNANKYEYQIETSAGATNWMKAEKIQEITPEQNMTIRARYNDGTSGIGQKEIKIDNIDTIAPDAYEMRVTSTDSTIRLIAETQDKANEGAREGIAGIARIEYRLEDGEWQTSGTYTGLEANTAYRVYSRVIDNAGNIREASNNAIAVKTKLEGDDSELTASVSTTEWTNKNVSIYLSTEGSGKLQYREEGDEEWTDYNRKIEVSSNKIIQARVENGDEIEIEVDNIDRLYPKAFSPEVIYKDKHSITITGVTDDTEETILRSFEIAEGTLTEEENTEIQTEIEKINGIIAELETDATLSEEQIMQELITRGITTGAIDEIEPNKFVATESGNKYVYEIVMSEEVKHEIQYICKNDNWEITEITYGESGIQGYTYVVEYEGRILKQQENVDGSYTFEDLDANTTYTLYIKAKDYAGNETISTKIEVQTPVDQTKEGSVRFDYSNTYWTNETVYVYLSVADETDYESTIEYQIVGQGDQWLAYGYDGIAVGTNCTIRARLTDEHGAKGEICTGTVSNIDTQAPEINVENFEEIYSTYDRDGDSDSGYTTTRTIYTNEYTQIAFRDAEKSKYSGSSGIAYYMLCNPDGSIFIDNKYEVSPNLYDINHTYQSGGWYWFNMTTSYNQASPMFRNTWSIRIPRNDYRSRFMVPK